MTRDGSSPSTRDGSFEVVTSERALGGELVVGCAMERHLVRLGAAAFCPGRAVLDLQVAPGGAAVAMLVDERALQAVALDDLALRGVRDVVTFGRPLLRGARGLAETLLLDVGDEQIQRPLDDRLEVGAAVAHEIA